MDITIVEYAKRHGKSPATVRHKAERGGFKTARRIGRDWLIDENEPYIDRRITHGNTIGYRKRLEEKKAQEQEKSL